MAPEKRVYLRQSYTLGIPMHKIKIKTKYLLKTGFGSKVIILTIVTWRLKRLLNYYETLHNS